VSHQDESVIIKLQMHEHPEREDWQTYLHLGKQRGLQELYITYIQNSEAGGLMCEPRGF